MLSLLGGLWRTLRGLPLGLAGSRYFPIPSSLNIALLPLLCFNVFARRKQRTSPPDRKGLVPGFHFRCAAKPAVPFA